MEVLLYNHCGPKTSDNKETFLRFRWYKQIGDAVESYKSTSPAKTTVSVTKSVPILPVDSSKVAVVSNEVVTKVHE